MPSALHALHEPVAEPRAAPAIRALILACAATLVVAGWLYLVHLHHAMTLQMSTLPWSLADAAFTLAMWVVMMIAMMAGPATPALLLFAGMQSSAPRRRVLLNVAAFGAGYFLVWTAFSLAATLLQWLIHDALAETATMAIAHRTLAAAVVIAAGVHQWLPVKSACLAHCRSPLGFFMTSWREGVAGAAAMGIRHGAFCLGCCWVLMLVLFAVGVMNLVWVAALSLLVLVEKVTPAGPLVSRIAGGVLVALGIAVLFGAL